MVAEKTVTAEFSRNLVECQAALRLYILRRIGNPQDTDDLLQQTNLYLLERAETFDAAKAPFMAWAREMVGHQLRKWRQTVARERLVFDDETLALLEAESSGEAPEDLRADVLRFCLKSLLPEQRERLFQHYLQDRTLEWMSRRWKTSYHAEASRLKRICKKLYDCIKGRSCALPLRERG